MSPKGQKTARELSRGNPPRSRSDRASRRGPATGGHRSAFEFGAFVSGEAEIRVGQARAEDGRGRGRLGLDGVRALRLPTVGPQAFDQDLDGRAVTEAAVDAQLGGVGPEGGGGASALGAEGRAEQQHPDAGFGSCTEVR